MTNAKSKRKKRKGSRNKIEAQADAEERIGLRHAHRVRRQKVAVPIFARPLAHEPGHERNGEPEHGAKAGGEALANGEIGGAREDAVIRAERHGSRGPEVQAREQQERDSTAGGQSRLGLQQGDVYLAKPGVIEPLPINEQADSAGEQGE